MSSRYCRKWRLRIQGFVLIFAIPGKAQLYLLANSTAPCVIKPSVYLTTNSHYSYQKRPTGKPMWSIELHSCLCDFAESARLMCEVSSLCGIACLCLSEAVKDPAEIRNHGAQRSCTVSLLTMSIGSFVIEVNWEKMHWKKHIIKLGGQQRKYTSPCCQTSIECLRQCYLFSNMGVLVMYSMTGYSLKVNSVRGILEEVVDACEDRLSIGNALTFMSVYKIVGTKLRQTTDVMQIIN